MWIVEAYRHTPDGMVADKRVYIDLTADESKELHHKLLNEKNRKGQYYWHYVRSFDEKKSKEGFTS